MQTKPDSNAIEKTPREVMLADLAEKAKEVKPAVYRVSSRNTKAKRVIHDHLGNQVTIEPGESKEGILLRPNIAEYLDKGDLAVTATAGNS